MKKRLGEPFLTTIANSSVVIVLTFKYFFREFTEVLLSIDLIPLIFFLFRVFHVC